MIELKKTAVGYGRIIVAENVSFTAKAGEITVLLGKNGCGKSTLIRSISGNLPYGGSIMLDGIEVHALKPKERAKRIAIMPQILLSPEITITELVSYGRQPYTGFTGILSENDKKFVAAVINDTGITKLANARVDRISGGERQKAYFAALLAQNTENLVLDEPGAFLDAEYMNNLCAFLLKAKSEGKTVLAVLHDVNRALEIADKLVVLDKKIVFDGDRDTFIANGIAEHFFSLKRFKCIGEDGEHTVLYR